MKKTLQNVRRAKSTWAISCMLEMVHNLPMIDIVLLILSYNSIIKAAVGQVDKVAAKGSIEKKERRKKETQIESVSYVAYSNNREGQIFKFSCKSFHFLHLRSDWHLTCVKLCLEGPHGGGKGSDRHGGDWVFVRNVKNNVRSVFIRSRKQATERFFFSRWCSRVDAQGSDLTSCLSKERLLCSRCSRTCQPRGRIFNRAR
jgi:hypothetical protein